MNKLNLIQKKSIKTFIFSTILVILFIFWSNQVFASSEIGSINQNYKYAWGENIGWINFACTNCNVVITDNVLTGYAWSNQFGWINLNPTNGGVLNDREGILSGFAWGENIGWIDFTGVTIDNHGNFLGYANVTYNNSKISFNCINEDTCDLSSFWVKTDWIPKSARPNGSSGSLPNNIITNIINPIIADNSFVNFISNTGNGLINLWNGNNNSNNLIADIPTLTPFSFGNKWNLLPVSAIRTFVFAPLPYEIKMLASKFRELDKTFQELGIRRLSDMDKLENVTLNIPGISDVMGNVIRSFAVNKYDDLSTINNINLEIPGFNNEDFKFKNNINVGDIALIKGLPLAKLPLLVKNNLPKEFVFARTNSESIDLNVSLFIGEKGEVNQKISSLPGKNIRYVIKPLSPAKSVTGYFVYKTNTPKISKNQIPRSMLSASAIFSMSGLVQKIKEDDIPKEFVLSSFVYNDDDNDGIYTADVSSPTVSGTYEVITVIEYIDSNLGIRMIRLINVVDPEGYVYEKNNDKEIRIPKAKISLYSYNNEKDEYELWNAKSYQQENPQMTDIRGTYSFLVPEGTYYIEADAIGYKKYHGDVFNVIEGSGIHQNIKLEKTIDFKSIFDFRNIVLFVILLLLIYNLYRNKLLNFSKKYE